MDDLTPYLPALGRGVLVSIQVGALSILVMVLVAFALSLANRSPYVAVRRIAFVITEFMRGNSAIVLLFWVFFAVPLLPGHYQPTGVASAVVVLGVAGGAYASESIRGALGTVPSGQLDACEALGFGFWRREMRIVYPQAMPTIVGSVSTMSVEVFKWTAVVSLVTVQDAVYWVETIRSQHGHTLLLYALLVAGFYLASKVIKLFYLGVGAVLTPSKIRSRRGRRRPAARSDDVGLALYVPGAGGR